MLVTNAARGDACPIAFLLPGSCACGAIPAHMRDSQLVACGEVIGPVASSSGGSQPVLYFYCGLEPFKKILHVLYNMF